MNIYIYTDGACKGNPGPGGWAIAAYAEECETPMHEQYAHNESTTNNQMELTAVINALAYMCLANKTAKYYICTDSAYIVNCFANKWYEQWEANGWKNAKKQPVANKVLWEIILQLYRGAIRQGYNFRIVKVAGHSVNQRNNYVDKLAVKASKENK